MFKIGEFSRIARVSCRLLRYYEELGLMRPARIDGDSGYRYYSASQLPRLNRILVLRELGLSLEQIGRILTDELPASELRGMLLMRRAEVEQSLETEAQRLRQIETRIAQIEASGELTADDVVLREEPAHKLLSMRQTIASFVEGIRLIGELVEAVPRVVGTRALGQFVAIAHAQEFEPDNIDVEFGFFLQGSVGDGIHLPDGRKLTVRDVPRVERLAACVRIGSPQAAHLTTARIGLFIEANGYRICGPSREVFLQRPQPDRMEDAIVEMQFPIERA
ncbi:MAG TPA: MerR family transcriptional regulator [Burkholderiales bacterium]|nr:MerR family transcriptional regulator [Burkholderiales bacterium]